MGLLYGTYCPPGLRVLKKAAAGPGGRARRRGSRACPWARAPPRDLAVRPEPPPPLPDHPYRSLDVYDREHRALFVGRDDDVIRFALVLDDCSHPGLAPARRERGRQIVLSPGWGHPLP